MYAFVCAKHYRSISRLGEKLFGQCAYSTERISSPIFKPRPLFASHDAAITVQPSQPALQRLTSRWVCRTPDGADRRTTSCHSKGACSASFQCWDSPSRWIHSDCCSNTIHLDSSSGRSFDLGQMGRSHEHSSGCPMLRSVWSDIGNVFRPIRT